jgi:CubicO group peptidase (beta-lactamase class C family)
MAKSVASTLIGMAMADGHISSLDDPLERYVPALRLELQHWRDLLARSHHRGRRS